MNRIKKNVGITLFILRSIVKGTHSLLFCSCKCKLLSLHKRFDSQLSGGFKGGSGGNYPLPEVKLRLAPPFVAINAPFIVTLRHSFFNCFDQNLGQTLKS